MLNEEEAARLTGATVVDPGGEELGRVDTLFTHSADDRAAWAAVDTGERQVLVPLDGARTEGDRLVVRYDREALGSAPDIRGDALDADGAQRLYEHYGIDDSTLRDDSGFATDQPRRREHGLPETESGGAGARDADQRHP